MAKNIVLDIFRITGKRKIFIFTGINNAMKKNIPQPQYSRIKNQTLHADIPKLRAQWNCLRLQ